MDVFAVAILVFSFLALGVMWFAYQEYKAMSFGVQLRDQLERDLLASGLKPSIVDEFMMQYDKNRKSINRGR